ncbi:MAG: sigma-70 family RNA polymerase sigma factor [Candidatus Zixiibacteriota bacterium]|nr:MAG: sigma-70 family RNA polymerase sigma factor [candidate division Zixibacteria bacterium]
MFVYFPYKDIADLVNKLRGSRGAKTCEEYGRFLLSLVIHILNKYPILPQGYSGDHQDLVCEAFNKFLERVERRFELHKACDRCRYRNTCEHRIELPKFRSRTSFRSYFLRSVNNFFIDLYRKYGDEPRTISIDDPDSSEKIRRTMGSVDSIEISAVLEKSLDDLGTQDKLIARCTKLSLDGFPSSTIEQLLKEGGTNISERTVRRKIEKGRDFLSSRGFPSQDPEQPGMSN